AAHKAQPAAAGADVFAHVAVAVPGRVGLVRVEPADAGTHRPLALLELDEVGGLERGARRALAEVLREPVADVGAGAHDRASLARAYSPRRKGLWHFVTVTRSPSPVAQTRMVGLESLCRESTCARARARPEAFVTGLLGRASGRALTAA